MADPESFMEKMREEKVRKEILGGEVKEEKLGEPVIGEKLEARSDTRPEHGGVAKAVDISYDAVTEAMAGRLESDIPMDDEYWQIKNLEMVKWNKAKDRVLGESYTTPPTEPQPKSSLVESVERQSLQK